ncbi:hypothetical protein CC1G_00130 [Coprinopsis cinerea okayama7|uniref:ACB domain-containing protein n=1 Tax=Coprinopsis cinerea (strain Okayama-7 / 130 / ATCC MYA-4618 / FGSC 9003) TaxID=240176 RepID=A8NWV4_COPC7|nr:hypothetical protein CC1G_00130 [Coprinopsis cinerea okayama7\|eukprot:XP_001836994.2 hypothetical protein CC1G_00130 [Coprinopsis cinerea okayama7\
MATHELIDAQFDRAVQIVQSLPKTGPIQTDYEEKLQILYKQATVGNVQPPRPGIFDMLGRAKWDAWAKHKDLDSYEAKWLYVEALLKVLRRYSDRTIARDLVQELESYGGDPSNLVLSHTFSKSPGSETSGTTDSEVGDMHTGQPQIHWRLGQPHASQDEEEETGSEEDETDDEARDLPPSRTPIHYDHNRPQSSHSVHRYRTPAGSLLMGTPPAEHQRVPHAQPLPGFETTSAFATPPPPTHAPFPHPQPPSHGSYPETIREREPLHSPQTTYPYRPGQYGPSRPASRPTLERAIENVQAHLAALNERVENVETRLISRSHPSISPKGGNSPRWFGGAGSPAGGRGPHWDIEELGLWSSVLVPLSRGLERVREWAVFFARDENRSPAMIIVRRLCLDVSFLVVVVAIIGSLWRRSGVRRREIRAALGVLWRALIGSKPPRAMAEKGI